MPKKKQDDELEVEVSTKQPRKNSLARRWYDDHVVNNRDDIDTVCELTARSAKEQFNMFIRSGNHEIYGCIFYATLMSAMDFLKGKQKQYNAYSIQIANSINIGFTNDINDENEKNGNFTVFLEFIGTNRAIVDDTAEISEDSSTTNFIRWKQLNIKKEVEIYKEIQEIAYQKLRAEFKISLRSSECVIPLFCIFMDHISAVLKQKYKELEGTGVSETSMNVMGLFDAYYSINEEDGAEVIEFAPTVAMKLYMKSDEVADK